MGLNLASRYKINTKRALKAGKNKVNQSRVELLEKFIEEDPSDPFNYYALAIEYQQIDPAKATELFEYLLTRHTDYLPVYYTTGIWYADIGHEAKAITTLTKGIEIAKVKSDFKALRELQSALLNLE